MGSADETTKLTEDFQKTPGNPSDEITGEKEELDINEAIERAGGGLGLVLYSVGPFLLFCLEGAEIVVLSIIAVILRCEWDLSTTSIAALQSVAMVGMMMSSLLSSNMGDKYGRRPMALIGAVGTTVVGLASGFTTNFWQLLLLRGILGVFIGVATPSAAALAAEVAPIKFRSIMLSYGALAWGIGCSLTSGLAYLLIEPYGWRGLIIGVSLLFSPSILFLAITNESPRFDARKGNLARAEKTVITIAQLNRADMKKVKLKKSEFVPESDSNGFLEPIREMQSLGLGRDLIVLNIYSAFVIYLYYCLSYASPRFVNEGYCSVAKLSANKTCNFDNDSLFDIGVIGLFEPLGVLIAIFLVDKIGRRKTFQLANGIIFLSLTALYFCVNNLYLMALLIASKFGSAQAGWAPTVLTVEYFPTTLRAFALSFGISFQRFGALAGLISVNFLFNAGPRIVLVVCQVATVIMGICLVFLKRETMGTQLQ